MKEIIEVDDEVLYRNTRGNIKSAKVKSLEIVSGGRQWFSGVDTKTGASVYYPTHISLRLMKDAENRLP